MNCYKCDDTGEVEIAYGERYLCDCPAGKRLRAERDNDGNRLIDKARERAEEWLVEAMKDKASKR